MAAPLPTPELPTSVAGTNPVMAQAMLRVTDPVASHIFYEELGMKFLTRFDFADLAFSLFFFGYTEDVPPDMSLPQSERAKWLWSRPYPTVELTWNWTKDTFEESMEAAKKGDTGDEKYVSGNSEPTGFGHLLLWVRRLTGVVARLKVRDIEIAGRAEGCIEFIDPTGYHLRAAGEVEDGGKITEEDPVFGVVMMRIKDPRKAIVFFGKLGFKLMARIDEKGISEYYMGYTDAEPASDDLSVEEKKKWLQGRRECMLKLVHLWGTEDREEQMFTNGNTKPYRGFGHVGIIVDDIYSTVEGMEKDGYTVVRKPGPFQDVGEIAFVSEPSTGYWVEIIKREGTAASAPYTKPLPA